MAAASTATAKLHGRPRVGGGKYVSVFEVRRLQERHRWGTQNAKSRIQRQQQVACEWRGAQLRQRVEQFRPRGQLVYDLPYSKPGTENEQGARSLWAEPELTPSNNHLCLAGSVRSLMSAVLPCLLREPVPDARKQAGLVEQVRQVASQTGCLMAPDLIGRNCIIVGADRRTSAGTRAH